MKGGKARRHRPTVLTYSSISHLSCCKIFTGGKGGEGGGPVTNPYRSIPRGVRGTGWQ